MRVEGSKLAFPTTLAVLLTVALTFATLELPVVVNRCLVESLGFPDFNPGFQSELIEEFMRSHYVRLIGYASLAAVVVLIVVGFVTKRTGLSAVGSVMFFLPTFGYFAAYMFFLSGIGILRVLWIPIWGQSTDLLKLGDVAYVPYMIVSYPLALLFSLFIVDPSSPIAGLLREARMIHFHWNGFHVDIRTPIAYALIGCGLLIFLLGTIAWLHAKLQKSETVDFWLYKYSRHPQYLGWIIWSYGLMLLASYTPVVRGGVNPGASFPWLISCLLIICVALTEEIEMMEKHGGNYTRYRKSAMFMLPLPRVFYSLTTLPFRILFKKDRPEGRREVIVTFIVYAIMLVLVSLPFVLLSWPPGLGWTEWPYSTWPYV